MVSRHFTWMKTPLVIFVVEICTEKLLKICLSFPQKGTFFPEQVCGKFFFPLTLVETSQGLSKSRKKFLQ